MLKFLGSEKILFSTCIISGMARVGKTLLCSVLSTADNVEYAEEPWTAQFFPIAVSNALFSEPNAGLFFAEYVRQLFYEAFLLRYANFRPIDLSYIGNKKNKELIKYRINNLKSWLDIGDISNSVFILNLSETVNELGFIHRSLPKCKIVYVIRHAVNVAEEVEKKKWFCVESLKNPVSPNLFKCYNGLFFPFWVKDGEEDFFVSLSEFEKGLYYYNIMVERSITSMMLLNEDCMIIKYEDFCSNKIEKYKDIKLFLGLVDGKLTKNSLAKIKSENESFKLRENVRQSLIEWTNSSLRFFHYEEIS